MGKIKSALEIALERTETVKGDKEAGLQFEAKQKGKRAANEFMKNTGDERGAGLEEALKNAPKDEAAAFREGAFETLLLQYSLPSSHEDMDRIARAGQGIQIILGDKSYEKLLIKFLPMLDDAYLGAIERIGPALMRKYANKLKQKEEELSRRLGGQPVKLDPFQDPEFAAAYNKEVDRTQNMFQHVVDQAREETAALFQGKIPTHRFLQ